MDYSQHIKLLNDSKTFNVGDSVIVLEDYMLFSGVVLKVNPKSVKIKVFADRRLIEHTQLYKPEKILTYGTPSVLVWETWKGTNGRGAYRLETKIYTECFKKVESIPRSRYLYETGFGIIDSNAIERYLN